VTLLHKVIKEVNLCFFLRVGQYMDNLLAKCHENDFLVESYNNELTLLCMHIALTPKL